MNIIHKKVTQINEKSRVTIKRKEEKDNEAKTEMKNRQQKLWNKKHSKKSKYPKKQPPPKKQSPTQNKPNPPKKLKKQTKKSPKNKAKNKPQKTMPK